MSMQTRKRKRNNLDETAESATLKKATTYTYKWKEVVEKLVALQGQPPRRVLYSGDMELGGGITVTDVVFADYGSTLSSSSDLYIRVHFQYTVHKMVRASVQVLVIPQLLEHAATSKNKPWAYTTKHEALIDETIGTCLKNAQICARCCELRFGECTDCKLFMSLATLVGERKIEVGRFQQEECPICKTEYTPTAAVARIDCDHCFHYKCIAQLNKPECPLCKHAIRYLFYRDSRLAFDALTAREVD